MSEEGTSEAQRRADALKGVSESAASIGRKLGERSDQARLTAEADNVGLTAGQAAFARNLKLPGNPTAGATQQSTERSGEMTPGQKAFAAGLKIPT